MLLFRPPGVYRPQGDTRLLAETLRTARVGARVLDVGTGTGVLALAAARGGAAQVIAVDSCARAVFTARVNALLRRLPVRVVHSDLFEAVAGEVFDVIVANPPYVCSDGLSSAGRSAHVWDGGLDGRAVLDRLCAAAPPLLAPGGMLLLLQSALCGIQTTVERLRSQRLRVAVVARRQEPFGPVMRARAAQLERCGLIGPEQRYEDLVVIRAERW
ncbi:methyltransferase [Actinoallomurus bryophytorum]|uniref:Release factor glutamine methyltransferase n=1 Tax=Actinoallomurus bryophytorum TaxID=1490222 RepID=A0A543CJC2_9ACTN|nr:HemK2/MTQ2 family protein methyltransferase [Actinoallomurus bryophytorum]TQL97201.1 release factor glutamine methyltransferase [Actinoallomurus bryophytorum]